MGFYGRRLAAARLGLARLGLGRKVGAGCRKIDGLARLSYFMPFLLHYFLANLLAVAGQF